MKELCHYCLLEMVCSYEAGCDNRAYFQKRLDAVEKSRKFKCVCKEQTPTIAGHCECQCICGETKTKGKTCRGK